LAKVIGRDKALDLAVEALGGADGWDLSRTLAEMEARSGAPIGEGR
jgi:hypothetical protein